MTEKVRVAGGGWWTLFSNGQWHLGEYQAFSNSSCKGPDGRFFDGDSLRQQVLDQLRIITKDQLATLSIAAAAILYPAYITYEAVMQGKELERDQDTVVLYLRVRLYWEILNEALVAIHPSQQEPIIVERRRKRVR